jgi:organic hydroperoxide reductase OsmC/OhrA
MLQVDSRFNHVTLRPKNTWGGPAPAAEALQHMHEASHRGCFIANSVTAEVSVESA